ncbi:hypothetical protein RJ640_022580 [Escallonia rubra]|uniref:DUF7803 domain-containing protein n=1 Tax=Escallonia rubra TaxID=112253 RepID=A0AA88UQY7_9ASTE|nr:hypothetical protein RJ640_022580 [Escallonia rubra]
MEETILVGDDLMMGPPSPIIPTEIASHVLEGVDLCDGILRNLFLCLQINDIEPFCQDEIALYRQCAGKRDMELRQRLQDSERKLGSSMPFDEAKKRASQLESEVTSLESGCDEEMANYEAFENKVGVEALDSGKWNGRHGRISPEMEFAWSAYRYQEAAGGIEVGTREQENERSSKRFYCHKKMVFLVTAFCIG